MRGGGGAGEVVVEVRGVVVRQERWLERREVREDAPGPGRDHDVLGLDVPVAHVARVRLLHGHEELVADEPLLHVAQEGPRAEPVVERRVEMLPHHVARRRQAGPRLVLAHDGPLVRQHVRVVERVQPLLDLLDAALRPLQVFNLVRFAAHEHLDDHRDALLHLAQVALHEFPLP